MPHEIGLDHAIATLNDGSALANPFWHIDSGSFGEVALDGLNVALMIYSPGHMLQTKWQVALYADELATEAQADALTQIYTGQAGGLFEALGGFIGEVLGDAQADRTAGTVGSALAIARRGAQILRIHDVASVHQALLLFEAGGGLES